MAMLKKASPKDLIWAGSVQWESGDGSPIYAYAFGLDEQVVDVALQQLHNGIVQKEFHENRDSWTSWLGQSSRVMNENDLLEGIEEAIKIRGPSRHQLDEMWFEGAHMPEVLKRIETEPLVIDLPGLSFDDLAPYCEQSEALQPFIIGGESSIAQQPESTLAQSRKSTMYQRRTAEVLEQGHYVTLERLPNGDLKMIATDEFHNEFLPSQNFDPEAYAEDERWGDHFDYYGAKNDLIEDIRANSSWDWVAPESIGALTEAPIITDDMDYGDEAFDEYGNPTPHQEAKIWWFPNYAIRDFIDDLIRDGESVFTYVPAEEEPVQASITTGRTTAATNKEILMTRRREPAPKRRTMRRRATAKQIRKEVRERLERRVEARKPSQQQQGRPAAAAAAPAVEERPERRVGEERLEELRRENRREQRVASLEERREEREHKARLAAIQDRREKRESEARLAVLNERREERAHEAHATRLEGLRTARPEGTPSKEEKPTPTRRQAAVSSTSKKQIYVKADNSAGMPEGYYELDERATEAYQVHLQRKAAAAKAAPKKRTKKKTVPKVAAAPVPKKTKRVKRKKRTVPAKK